MLVVEDNPISGEVVEELLADAGLVRDVKVGRERLWQFEPLQLEEARRALELIGQQWEQALGRLKRTLEG